MQEVLEVVRTEQLLNSMKRGSSCVGPREKAKDVHRSRGVSG